MTVLLDLACDGVNNRIGLMNVGRKQRWHCWHGAVESASDSNGVGVQVSEMQWEPLEIRAWCKRGLPQMIAGDSDELGWAWADC
jgi:hypothetical protein